MAKRTLKRQLNLLQVIMLGTAGTLGSGIFVLTGHAAAVAGPATILAIVIGGILSFSIAFNYCELATTYPETGGAMTYVREAWGKGLIAFLVGSMDCISSTFYTALSAVGFAYSLSVFFPAIPIVPVAIAAIIVFVILNILGVTKVGNFQMVLGAILLFAFAVYIIAGFTMPNGFHPQTLFPNGRMFESSGFFPNLAIIMRTIALIYAAYVGFEVIADDAEEIRNPSKNIPIAIMVSLALITIVYSLTVTVALGTTPWQQLAGSETALSDTIKVFFPGLGVTIIAIAGMVGALTSINSSMLSATRESFTLSRDGAWPAMLSRLNRVRVPFFAIIMIGVVSILVTAIGAVNFLSYITSAGYLFVLFLSNMAMIRLRKKYPYIHRPYKVPLFPLTPLLASLTCLIVIVFSEWKALLFTVGVLALFSMYYYGRIGVEAWKSEHTRSLSPGRYRLLVPVDQRAQLDNVVQLAASVAEAKPDTNLCLLQVIREQETENEQGRQEISRTRQYLLEKFIHYAVKRNVPLYSKTVNADTQADGIIEEIRNENNVRMVMFKWPENKEEQPEFEAMIQRLSKGGVVNFAVLYDRGISQLEDILVPVGGGYHSKMAVRLAENLASVNDGHVDYLRVVPNEIEEDAYEDQMAFLQEVVMTELGNIPGDVGMHITRGDDAANAIIDEVHQRDYDLVIIGSYEGDRMDEPIFGNLVDRVRRGSSCSVLVVRQHERPAASWLRRQLKSSN
ncbi:MAG: amino acid permease [Anaerolineaceae bacterium]|nr:amino acid permease [Anaerolineaceae bacterium]